MSLTMPVRTVQSGLKQYRITQGSGTSVPSPGDLDGVWGPNTERALNAFLRESQVLSVIPNGQPAYRVVRNATRGMDQVQMADAAYWRLVAYANVAPPSERANQVVPGAVGANPAPVTGSADLPSGVTPPAPTFPEVTHIGPDTIPGGDPIQLPEENIFGARFRMPVWGWWALGIGGVAAAGVLGWGVVDQGWFGIMPKKSKGRRTRGRSRGRARARSRRTRSFSRATTWARAS